MWDAAFRSPVQSGARLPAGSTVSGVEQPCAGAVRVWEDLSTRRFHCRLPLPAMGAVGLARLHLQNESTDEVTCCLPSLQPPAACGHRALGRHWTHWNPLPLLLTSH